MFFNFTNIVDSQDNVDLTPRGKPVTQRPTSQDRSPFKAGMYHGMYHSAESSLKECRVMSLKTEISPGVSKSTGRLETQHPSVSQHVTHRPASQARSPIKVPTSRERSPLKVPTSRE